jgi:O-antigen/teichoic acid export membrane protein
VFLTSALHVPYKEIVRISSPLIADNWKKREMEKMKELYTQVSSLALVIGLGFFLLIWSNIDFLFSFFILIILWIF